MYKIAAIKSQKKISTNTDLNIDIKFNVNTESESEVKKRSIYKILLTWHKWLDHLNAKNIIQFAADSESRISIKDSKKMNFCETCALADSKQKISQKSQH